MIERFRRFLHIALLLAVAIGPNLHLGLAFGAVPYSTNDRVTVGVTHHHHRHHHQQQDHGSANCPCCDDPGCAVCGLFCANAPALLESFTFGPTVAATMPDHMTVAELFGAVPRPEPRPPDLLLAHSIAH